MGMLTGVQGDIQCKFLKARAGTGLPEESVFIVYSLKWSAHC